jgi:hypothetical protein
LPRAKLAYPKGRSLQDESEPAKRCSPGHQPVGRPAFGRGSRRHPLSPEPHLSIRAGPLAALGSFAPGLGLRPDPTVVPSIDRRRRLEYPDHPSPQPISARPEFRKPAIYATLHLPESRDEPSPALWLHPLPANAFPSPGGSPPCETCSSGGAGSRVRRSWVERYAKSRPHNKRVDGETAQEYHWHHERQPCGGDPPEPGSGV